MGENFQDNQVIPVFPTAYFPSLEYLAKAFEKKAFAIEINETFQKQSIRNRCVILGPNGLQSLTVPVKKPQGSKTVTGEIVVDYSTDWVKNHLESLQTAYGNYPYFDHYFPDFEKLLKKEHEKLIGLNETILNFLNEHLVLNYQNSFTEFFNLNITDDFRPYPFIDKSLKLTVAEETWGISKNKNLSALHFLFAFGPLTRVLLVKELNSK